MILDALLQFDPAATPWTGTTNSQNVIDLGVTSGVPTSANGGGARDIGIGDDPAMKLLVQVITTFLGGTSIIVNFQGAADNGSGAPAAFTTYVSSATVLLASLVVGARLFDIDVPRPPPGAVIPRFLRLTYVAAGTFTAGVIESLIVLDRHDQVEQTNAVLGGYPVGITVAN
jgi:hypothetical protein